MAMHGLLDDRSTARQLLAAGVLDLMLLYVIAGIAAPHLPARIVFLQRQYHEIALFLVMIPLFWAVTDLLLAGHSPGRLALGLRMAGAEGRSPALHWRLTRLTGRLLTLGLAGLRLDKPAGYDRLARIRWLSPLSPHSARPTGEWILRFLSGPFKGKSIRLDRIRGFTPEMTLRIGRDPGWAMLVLPDPQVSGRHCEIDFSGSPRLKDLGSQNGTFVDERRAEPGKWIPIEAAHRISVARQIIEISR